MHGHEDVFGILPHGSVDVTRIAGACRHRRRRRRTSRRRRKRRGKRGSQPLEVGADVCTGPHKHVDSCGHVWVWGQGREDLGEVAKVVGAVLSDGENL